MIDKYDIAYNLRRKDQELAAAASATDPAARSIHEKLADRYADRAWGERKRRCEEGNPC